MKCVKFRTGSTNGLRRAEHLVLFHPREHQRGQGHRSQASVPETGSFSTFLLMGYEDLCQQILHYAGSLLRLREEQQMRQPTNVILMAGEAAVLLCLCVLPMLIRKPPSHCGAGCWITATGSCHHLLKAAGRACRARMPRVTLVCTSPELAGSLLLWVQMRPPVVLPPTATAPAPALVPAELTLAG